jgi:hypothetical protein
VSRAQRLSFLAVAVVIAVVAAILLASGGDDDVPETTGATATVTPTPTETAAAEETATPTPTPTATPKPEVPLVTSGKVTRLRFNEGDIVRFRVRSDVADHVHVHGYDVLKDVAPGKTVTFSFPATITGIFEVELEDAGEQIAQLRVDP